jgi:hypothetical protein
MEEILHGYNEDNEYDVKDMEEDGEYSESLKWEYMDIGNEQEDVSYPCYNGDGSCLCPGISRQIKTVLGTYGHTGGFSYDLIKKITTNSNSYAWSKVVNNKFYGSKWENIWFEEMYWALGMIMIMSLVHIGFGGIKQYFNQINKMYPSCTNPVEIIAINTKNCCDSRLTCVRFIQICAALHPEIVESEIEDMCHQLHAAIQFFNSHTKKTFIPGRYLSFDDGGIASKSRYDPVCQYNASKLDKSCIDFFILANATLGNYFTYHLDVCRGRILQMLLLIEKLGNCLQCKRLL